MFKFNIIYKKGIWFRLLRIIRSTLAREKLRLSLGIIVGMPETEIILNAENAVSNGGVPPQSKGSAVKQTSKAAKGSQNAKKRKKATDSSDSEEEEDGNEDANSSDEEEANGLSDTSEQYGSKSKGRGGGKGGKNSSNGGKGSGRGRGRPPSNKKAAPSQGKATPGKRGRPRKT